MLNYVDIETVSHCNARCTFCPQSQDPLPANTMSLELFEHICKELRKTNKLYKHFYVVLNHYGEPLLDKFFKERIKLLDKYRIDLQLHTNGTKLDKDKVAFLYQYKHVVQKIEVNMTTIDEEEWCATYGLPPAQFKKTFSNLLNLLKTFASVHKQPKGGIVLNGKIKDQLESMTSHPIKVDWYIMPHNNRSGNLKINNKNESDIYDTAYKGNDYMYTCLKGVLKSNFSVNYEGKVFLCCQDYYQKNIIGDLTKDSVQYILNTVEATHLRDQIYGKTPADKDLICRKCIHSVIDGLDFPLHHPQGWVRK